MNAFLVTLIIIAFAWFWSNSMRTRERALEVGAAACRGVGVQFLDQTVSLSRLGMGRDKRTGRMTFHRVYSFEFTQDGSLRREGRVAMQGDEVKAVHLDHADGPMVIQPDQRR